LEARLFMPSAKRQLEPVTAPPPVGRADLHALLGPAPLLEGEDAGAYHALFSHIRAAVEPKDAIEEFWVRDIAELLWETLRLRRLKAALMRAAAHEGLAKLLTPLVPNIAERTELVRAWARKDHDAERQVAQLLKKAGLDAGAITAQTLAVKLDTFERVDRLIAQTEARRNAVLREIERRREAVARRLREASTIIEDAEFHEVDAPEPDPR
jgi:hypothetical protein